MITRLTVLALATIVLTATNATSTHAQSGLPMPPTLAHSVAASLVSLTWTIPTGPAPTTLQIHAGSGPGLSDIAVVSVPATTNSFSATAPPGTYYVRILALNASGVTASNEVTVVVGAAGPCAAPGVPTGLTATPAPGSVTLNWNAPVTGGSPTGYTLLVGFTPAATNPAMYAVGPATTITSLAPIGTYFVRVVATNACGNSAPSAEVSFAVPALGLSVPAGVYVGTVANYVQPGIAPLTSFTLELYEPVPSVPVAAISAKWTDNRGCSQSNSIIAGTGTGPFITIGNFPCGGGTFALRVLNVSGNVYSGSCGLGSSGCTFQMIKQ